MEGMSLKFIPGIVSFVIIGIRTEYNSHAHAILQVHHNTDSTYT